MKAHELLDSPEKWCKKVYAEDQYGECVLGWEKSACKWCMLGALQKCYGLALPGKNGCIEAHVKILEVLKKLGIPGKDVAHYNDNHTFEEVRQVLIEADV